MELYKHLQKILENINILKNEEVGKRRGDKAYPALSLGR